MRVLWFTHLPADAVNRHFGRPTTGTGFWIHSLVQPLVDSGQVELGIATATAGDPAFHFSDGGVEYFNIPQQKYLEVYNILPKWRVSRYLDQAVEIVRQFKPDLVHVHGTERFFGLLRARRLIETPTVVSLQGLIRQLRHWSWGTMTAWDAIRHTSLWEITRNATVVADARRMARNVETEEEIIRGADAVIGRTAWDHANARDVNTNVSYYHIAEMMRPEFAQSCGWSLDASQAGTILTSSSAGPAKGLTVLLKAVAILRKWGQPVRLKIAGLSRSSARRSSSQYAFEMIRRLGLDDHVELLGWADGPTLISHMREARCLATASFIENSSNAVSEAQLFGIPCVAAHTGGLPSLIDDGKTGLLFSRGDEVMLAAQIERLIMDSALAESISSAGRAVARERHDVGQIVAAHLACYQELATQRRT